MFRLNLKAVSKLSIHQHTLQVDIHDVHYYYLTSAILQYVKAQRSAIICMSVRGHPIRIKLKV